MPDNTSNHMQIQLYQPPKIDTKQESILYLRLNIFSTVYNIIMQLLKSCNVDLQNNFEVLASVYNVQSFE